METSGGMQNAEFRGRLISWLVIKALAVGAPGRDLEEIKRSGAQPFTPPSFLRRNWGV